VIAQKYRKKITKVNVALENYAVRRIQGSNRGTGTFSVTDLGSSKDFLKNALAKDTSMHFNLLVLKCVRVSVLFEVFEISCVCVCVLVYNLLHTCRILCFASSMCIAEFVKLLSTFEKKVRLNFGWLFNLQVGQVKFHRPPLPSCLFRCNKTIFENCITS